MTISLIENSDQLEKQQDEILCSLKDTKFIALNYDSEQKTWFVNRHRMSLEEIAYAINIMQIWLQDEIREIGGIDV